MDFIDRTGHIFSLPSYSDRPIGYEYEESPYIFKFKSDNSFKLSVDNYYFLPIRFINRVNVDKETNLLKDRFNINIKIEDSTKFYLIDSDTIESKILNNNLITDKITLKEEDILQSQELSYVEEINIKSRENPETNEIEYYNDSEIGFKGCITEESISYFKKNIKYINPLTKQEYNNQIVNITDLEYGITYTDKNGDIQTYSQETDSNIILGVINIASLKKYIELDVKEEYVSSNENDYDLATSNNYLITTFYVVVKSSEAGIWSNNILIHVDDDWCPITVEAEIIDENEELIINGQNMGVSLPKEIIQAIYSSNYDVNIANEQVYYQKLKEYLINFMKIKGELGNYRSAINSLKWFEWGDKLTISKLFKNDNRIQRQYVKDFFDILNDKLYSYQLFTETSLLSLDFKLTETQDNEKQDLSQFFWGEGKPKVINKFNELSEVRYDEEEDIFYKGYFNFTFNDLGLKLAALKYYYEKYFLPLHVKIHDVYMSHQVFANDIKIINKTSNGITAKPVYISNNFSDEDNIFTKDVVFNDNDYDIIYFNRYYKKNIDEDYSDSNRLFIDTNFNEFSHYTTDFVTNDDNIYYEINDTCIRIPITFNQNTYYDVNLIFSRYLNKDDEDIENNLVQLFKSSFKFIQTNDRKYQSLILYPKKINEYNNDKFDSIYWLNNRFRIDLIVNGTLYNYSFYVKMPDFNIELGTLSYKYDKNFRQISSIEDNIINFNAFMYLPNLVNVNNLDFCEEVVNLSSNLKNYIDNNYKETIKFLNKKYLNVCHLLTLTDSEGSQIPYIENGDEIECMTWDDIPMFIEKNNDINLYSNFFNNDGSYKFDTSLIKINNHEYDLYIMHDYKYWYGILISKEPIDYVSKKDKTFKFGNKAKQITIGNYTLTYSRSDRKLLINRFVYNPSNGINHFTDEDIIVASLKNNDKLSFKLSNGSKWIISPLSLKTDNVDTITSNTELCILSISNKFSKYESGYYNVSIQYSVDDYIQHIHTKRAKFKIN